MKNRPVRHVYLKTQGTKTELYGLPWDYQNGRVVVVHKDMLYYYKWNAKTKRLNLASKRKVS